MRVGRDGTGRDACGQATEPPADEEQRKHDEKAVENAHGALDPDALSEDGEGARHQPRIARPVEREKVTMRNRAVEHARRVGVHRALVHVERLRNRRREHVREREDHDAERDRDDGAPPRGHRFDGRARAFASGSASRPSSSSPVVAPAQMPFEENVEDDEGVATSHLLQRELGLAFPAVAPRDRHDLVRVTARDRLEGKLHRKVEMVREERLNRLDHLSLYALKAFVVSL